ncbi:hypothetical protein TNCV_1709511 [Trichonephila clavipes]|nr:hypothetical protein TNCV_1709511 [Trichonephila clavipes]
MTSFYWTITAGHLMLTWWRISFSRKESYEWNDQRVFRHRSIDHVKDALGRRVAGRQPPHTLSKNWKELFWKSGAESPNS